MGQRQPHPHNVHTTTALSMEISEGLLWFEMQCVIAVHIHLNTKMRIRGLALRPR